MPFRSWNHDSLSSPAVMDLEEEFNIEIPDEDAERMRKVKDVVEYVGERLGRGTSSK